MIAKETYIIQTKQFLISDLLFKSNIRKSFEVFKSESCLNDLIYSGHSNINIYDGRLWLNCGIANKINEFDKKYIVDSLYGKKVYIPNFGGIRSKIELEKHKSVKELFNILNIRHKQINQVFIPNLGKLNYTNKVFPPNSFTYHRHHLNRYHNTKEVLIGKNAFGLCRDQSQSHIPLEIGKHLKINIKSEDQKINRILINDTIFFIDSRIKINITPYGLLSIHITYSINSNDFFTEKELILLQNELFRKNNFRIYFKNKIFNDLDSLYKYIEKKISHSILDITKAYKTIDFGTPNISIGLVLYNDQTDDLNDTSLIAKKVLGILNEDLNYKDYNQDFLESYNSLFGKYEGDFVYIKNNKLIYNLYSDSCKRTLFNWEVNNTFNYFNVKKKLNSFVNEKLIDIGLKQKLTKKEEQEIFYLQKFLSGFNHYSKLSSHMRKLFNEINRSFSYNYEDKENKLLLNDIKSRIESKKIQDSLILQPNFMGFGIDLMKLISFFKKGKN